MSIWKTLSYLQDLLNSKNLRLYFSAVIYQPHAELFHQYNFKLQNNCLIRATFLPLLLLLFLLSNLPSPSQWPQFPSPTPFSPLCPLPSVSLTPTVSLDRMAKRDLQALTLYLGHITPSYCFIPICVDCFICIDCFLQMEWQFRLLGLTNSYLPFNNYLKCPFICEDFFISPTESRVPKWAFAVWQLPIHFTFLTIPISFWGIKCSPVDTFL